MSLNGTGRAHVGEKGGGGGRGGGEEKKGDSDKGNTFAFVNLLSSDEEAEKSDQSSEHGPSARKKRRLNEKTEEENVRVERPLSSSTMLPSPPLLPPELPPPPLLPVPQSLPQLQQPAGVNVKTNPATVDEAASPDKEHAGVAGDDDDDDLQVVSCVLARTPEPRSQSKLAVFSPTDRRDGRHVRRSGRDRTTGGGGNAGEPLPASGTGRRRNSEAGKGAGAAEQLQVVDCRRGVNALVDYAHFRFQCVTKPFKHRRRVAKLEYCDKCFCYVCDDPVEKCPKWNQHYEAIDSSTHWKTLRDECLHARRKQRVDLAQAGSQFARIQQPVAISLLDSDVEEVPHRNVASTTNPPVAPRNPDQQRQQDKDGHENENGDDADDADDDKDDENESVGSVDDMLWYDTDGFNDVIRDASTQLEEIRLTPNSFSMTALASLLDTSRNVQRSSASRLTPQPYDPAVFD